MSQNSVQFTWALPATLYSTSQPSSTYIEHYSRTQNRFSVGGHGMFCRRMTKLLLLAVLRYYFLRHFICCALNSIIFYAFIERSIKFYEFAIAMRALCANTKFSCLHLWAVWFAGHNHLWVITVVSILQQIAMNARSTKGSSPKTKNVHRLPF